DQGARGEAAGLAGEEQAVAESSPLLFAELPDQHASFGWRKVAPFLPLRDESTMKRREHLMLKRAALASIQLESLPLVRVQAVADEELERTSGEILQRAHGRGQLATVKRLGNRGRQALSGRGIRHLPGLEQNRRKIRQSDQFLCEIGRAS